MWKCILPPIFARRPNNATYYTKSYQSTVYTQSDSCTQKNTVTGYVSSSNTRYSRSLATMQIRYVPYSV